MAKRKIGQDYFDSLWTGIKFNTLKKGQIREHRDRVMKDVYFWASAMDRRTIGDDILDYWDGRAICYAMGEFKMGPRTCVMFYAAFKGEGISIGDFAYGSKDIAKEVGFRLGSADDMDKIEGLSSTTVKYVFED
jgi:hypothetical protein